MKKPKPKVRMFHVNFNYGGAQIVVIPGNANVSLFSQGLLIKQAGGRQIGYLPNVVEFWELGTIAFHPLTLGHSKAEQKLEELPFALSATKSKGVWIGVGQDASTQTNSPYAQQTLTVTGK